MKPSDISAPFDPAAYGPVLAACLDTERLAELGPGTPRGDQRERLDGLSVDRAFAHVAVVDRSMAAACLAGAWLLNNFLEESHSISQAIDGATGSYWHGIMHRREPDFPNARYWFRQAGRHPILDTLGAGVRLLAQEQAGDAAALEPLFAQGWSPTAFVDLCQRVQQGDRTHETFCQTAARREWELLFDFCYRRAVGE